MIEVTTLAQLKLNEYMTQNNISSSLRVILMQGGCSGQALGLAIDELKEDDEIVTLGKLTILIERNLLQQCGKVVIDFLNAGSRSGFSITSTNPIADGGDGCSPGSCGSGGCGC